MKVTGRLAVSSDDVARKAFNLLCGDDQSKMGDMPQATADRRKTKEEIHPPSLKEKRHWAGVAKNC